MIDTVIGAIIVTLQSVILVYLLKLERRITRIETYLKLRNSMYRTVMCNEKNFNG